MTVIFVFSFDQCERTGKRTRRVDLRTVVQRSTLPKRDDTVVHSVGP